MAGTRLDGPEVPHSEMQQTEQERTFPFQTDVDDCLRVDCRRILELGVNLSFEADVGLNPGTTTAQIAAQQEFARLPKNRQKRGLIAWNTEKNSSLIRAGNG